VEVGSDIEIKWAAHLLQLNVPGIVAALTLKTSEMRNENLVIPLNIDQALGNYTNSFLNLQLALRFITLHYI
jgi:hypothetical protein